MAVDVTKIIMGAAVVKLGPYGGATEDVGATKDGASLACDRNLYDIVADQAMGVLDVKETSRQFSVKLNLLEATLKNIARAWGYPDSAVSGNTFKLGVPASTPYYKLEIVGPGPGTTTRTATFNKVVSVASGEHRFQKAGETVIPVEFRCLYDATAPAGQEFGTIVDA